MRKTKRGDGKMPELKEMKPTYKIFVLDDDEYLGLHKYIPGVKKDDLDISLGFANPKTKEAYVRKTRCKEMDDETIIHEAEELLAKVSPHEEDGIRWKKGMDIITPIIQAVATITGHPYIAAGIGAARGAYKQATGQGTLGGTLISTAAPLAAGALGAGAAGGAAYTAAKAGGQGIISSFGQALKAGTGSLLGMTPAATATYPAGTPVGVTNVGTYSQFPGASAANLATAPLSTAPQTLGIGQSILGSAMGAGIGSQIGQAPKVTTQGVGQITPVPPTPAAPFSLKSLVTPANILGAGSLLASQGIKQPTFQMPESVEMIRSKLLATGAEGGLTDIGKQARLELGNIMKATPTELYPTATDEYYNAALRRTRESYAQAEKQLDAAYNIAGVYGSGEHLAEKAKLKENLARTESALAAETEQRRFELARNAQYQAIQDSLGVDKDVMDDLVGLSGLDVQTAAMMYGAQVQDVQSIREALGTLGVELLVRGTTGKGMQTGGININLGNP